jgi:hypothetical protein
VGFKMTQIYIKATTRGLVTACSHPINIEVCGHETVSLLDANKQVFQINRKNSTLHTTTLDVTTMFDVSDSSYCGAITSY